MTERQATSVAGTVLRCGISAKLLVFRSHRCMCTSHRSSTCTTRCLPTATGSCSSCGAAAVQREPRQALSTFVADLVPCGGSATQSRLRNRRFAAALGNRHLGDWVRPPIAPAGTCARSLETA